MEEDSIRIVADEGDYDQARILFLEYMDEYGLDLEYFDFDLELSTLEHIYKNPNGFILLYRGDKNDIGALAMRRYREGVMELKRMFMPQYGFKSMAAETLLSRALLITKKWGYSQILLDVLPEMTELITLYKRQGFYLIPPFRYDPIPRTLFMKRDLT